MSNLDISSLYYFIFFIFSLIVFDGKHELVKVPFFTGLLNFDYTFTVKKALQSLE